MSTTDKQQQQNKPTCTGSETSKHKEQQASQEQQQQSQHKLRHKHEESPDTEGFTNIERGLQMLKIGDTNFEINHSLFQNTTVSHLIWNQKDCIHIDENAPVERALDIMVMRGISSIAVQKEGQWTGILNMGDIVAHMVGYVVGAGDDDTSRDDGQKHRHLETKIKEKEALKIPCHQLLGLTWESRHLLVFDAADRIDNAIRRLSEGNHRGLVQGRGWWQIISQWDIASWLATHCREMDDPNLANNRKEWLGSIVNATLGELKLAESKHVVTIPHDMSAIESFRRLASNGVSAMPIVASNGTLCGTLSVSDMRGMDYSKWKALELPVMEFLKVSNLLQHPQVVANAHMKLGDVLLKIKARDVHRVWLTSGDNKPIGVLSLTDLLHRIHQFINPEPKMLEDERMKSKKSSPAAAAAPSCGTSSLPGDVEGEEQQGGGTKDKDKCKCTSSQKMGGGDVATKGTGHGGAGQCSYGNSNCNCPPSCVCGGVQQSGGEQQSQQCGQSSGAAFAGTKSQQHQQTQHQTPQTHKATSAQQQIHGIEKHEATTTGRKDKH